MSTTRRPLGTGPTMSTRTTTMSSALRLLPVERAGSGALLDDIDEHQAVTDLKGRRMLGTGPEGVAPTVA